jgi:hypothetical protein
MACAWPDFPGEIQVPVQPPRLPRGTAAGIAGGIPVLEFTRQHTGHRFEAAMGVIRRPHGLAGGIVDQPHFIDHADGTNRTHTRYRQRPAHHETTAFPLPAHCCDLFDGSQPVHPRVRRFAKHPGIASMTIKSRCNYINYRQ